MRIENHFLTSFLFLLYHNCVNFSTVSPVRIRLQTENARNASTKFRTSHPNHAAGVYIIRNLLRYITNAEHCISSSRRKMRNARVRVMIYNKGRPMSAFVDEIHADA